MIRLKNYLKGATRLFNGQDLFRKLILTTLVLIPLGCGGGGASDPDGLWATTYIGTWTDLPDFDNLQPTKGYKSTTVKVDGSASSNYAMTLEGMIDIPKSQRYRFFLSSNASLNCSVVKLPSKSLVKKTRS